MNFFNQVSNYIKFVIFSSSLCILSDNELINFCANREKKNTSNICCCTCRLHGAWHERHLFKKLCFSVAIIFNHFFLPSFSLSFSFFLSLSKRIAAINKSQQRIPHQSSNNKVLIKRLMWYNEMLFAKRGCMYTIRVNPVALFSPSLPITYSDSETFVYSIQWQTCDFYEGASLLPSMQLYALKLSQKINMFVFTSHL